MQRRGDADRRRGGAAGDVSEAAAKGAGAAFRKSGGYAGAVSLKLTLVKKDFCAKNIEKSKIFTLNKYKIINTNARHKINTVYRYLDNGIY